MNKTYIKIIIGMFFWVGFSVGAATTQPSELTFSISPNFPKAGESFTVEARSSTVDAMRSSFQWYLNGKLVASGVGVISQTFIASKIGSVMSIDIKLNASDGRVFSRNLMVHVSDVDLIVRPATYVPYNYRGSSLATAPGILEVYALPHLFSTSGARLKAEDLFYEWSLNGSPLKKESGYSKSKILIEMPDTAGLYYTIKLKVSNSSNVIAATKTVTVPTEKSHILFYQTDPLTGRSSLSNISFNVVGGNNISIIAEPYFFGINSLARATFTWTADGVEFKQTEEKNPLLLEIVAPQNAAVLTNFSLLINDKKTLHQHNNAMLNIRTNQ